MPKHTLFVCKSCHCSSEKLSKSQPSDGTLLFEQLNTLFISEFSLGKLEILPVECLWACSHGCVVSTSSHDKPTYIFVNLLPDKSAAALIEFMKLYIESRKGFVPWKKFPELLQSAIFAQIPPNST